MVLRYHSKVLIVRVRRVAVSRPKNAEAKDRRKEEKCAEGCESFVHGSAPGSILRRGGSVGEGFCWAGVTEVTGVRA